MKIDRLTGHNVTHLIYPLRRKDKHISILENMKNNIEWEEILSSKSDTLIPDEENIKYIFPEVYDITNENSSIRKWIPSRHLYSYFHPSVQKVLFHDNKKLKVYRKKKINSRIFNASFYKDLGDIEQTSAFQFEWTSSEIYVFSQDIAYLVIRVSLRENIELENQKEKEYGYSVQKLNVWMKFLNRIRQNYKKYEGQGFLGVIEKGVQNPNFRFNPKYFFEYVEHFIENNNLNMIISSLECDDTTVNLLDYQRIEPNAYVHAFVQTDLSTPLTDIELHQVLSIDETEGESGYENSFFKVLLNDYVYRRWEPNTYYTSIDYGSVTICGCKNTSYRTSDSKVYNFSDVLYQHHTRQYLLLILLQYYYRDQLQEILSLYSGISELENEVPAKRVLKVYYDLNQHFFFDRITNEIQGMELWKFYQSIMDTDNLYSSVKADMQELNQRLLEATGKKQNNHIQQLTIIAALTGMLGMNLIIPRADYDNFFSTLMGWSLANLFLKSGAIIFNVFTVVLIIYVISLVGKEIINYLGKKTKKLWHILKRNKSSD